MHGPGAGVVGDGLVPSRPAALHGIETGDHKGRPYMSRPAALHGVETGDHKGPPTRAFAQSLEAPL